MVCAKARLLLNLIFSLFGVQWVLHMSVRSNLLGWRVLFVCKEREQSWKAIPLCLFWTLWKERNRRAFNDMEQSEQTIKFSFCMLLQIGLGYIKRFALCL